MDYIVTDWDGEKSFRLKLGWKCHEISETHRYGKELELNLRNQIE